jgi:CheY-like chemotaxis protein
VTTAPEKAGVLVATDSLSDAKEIAGLLRAHFQNVRVSTIAENASKDFEACSPDVLVLAFDAIAKAQVYYLGLYRLLPSLHEHHHRTVLLCTKEEVPQAFELCKKQEFDDYVLYWPLAYDGYRLPMTIWRACREMMELRVELPRRSELFSHSRHLRELEHTFDNELSQGERQIAEAHRSMTRLEHDLVTAGEEFSRRLARDGAAGLEVKDSEALAREIARLTSRQVAQAQVARVNGLEPMNAWVKQFKERVAPSIAGTRPLLEAVGALRPKLLVVDDDEMLPALVSGALEGARYELAFAADGAEALRMLRHGQPDLILMDFRLPGADGISLMRQLKASPEVAAIPIIMMTADARRETVKNSIDAGASDFLVKPFTRQSLRSKIESVFNR